MFDETKLIGLGELNSFLPVTIALCALAILMLCVYLFVKYKEKYKRYPIYHNERGESDENTWGRC